MLFFFGDYAHWRTLRPAIWYIIFINAVILSSAKLSYAQENGRPSAENSELWNGLQVSFGADVFRLRQSEIHGINALRLLYETPSGLYIGNSV
ncbi:MAG: hypothetical protein ACOC2C_07920, partial [Cyclonatronaceae bacterium]